MLGYHAPGVRRRDHLSPIPLASGAADRFDCSSCVCICTHIIARAGTLCTSRQRRLDASSHQECQHRLCNGISHSTGICHARSASDLGRTSIHPAQVGRIWHLRFYFYIYFIFVLKNVDEDVQVISRQITRQNVKQ